MKRGLAWGAGLLTLLLIAGFALLYTPDTDPAAMRAAYGAPPSRYLRLTDGLTVHYRDEGPANAPVIVLLHGSNADLHTWDAWAVRLSRRYRIVRFDQIGHGLTGPNPARRYDAAAFTDRVEQIASALHLQRFVLAGNSMGGWVAWEYARRHPGRLRGLVLIDAAGAPEDPHKQLPIGFRIARTPVLREITRFITPRSLIARTALGAYADPRFVTDATVDRIWRLLRYPGNRQATIDRFATPRVQVPRDQIACIATPTLILWGAEDKLIPVASAAWFHAALGNSRVIVYPGVGHVPMEEAAERSATDLARWVDALPAA